MRKIGLVIVFLFIVAFMVLKKAPSSEPVPTVVPNPPQVILYQPVVENSKAPTAPPLAQKPADLESPSVFEVRDEIARNPHVTPVSLIAFAANLGGQMELGMESPASAEKLFRDLQSCVLRQGARSARALCLWNAREIQKRYPELASRYENLVERAEPSVVNIAL